LETLTTNGINGGSGYSAPVQVTYQSPDGGSPQSVEIYLQNPLPERNPTYSYGYGYLTTGYLFVPGAAVGASGRITVTIARISSQPEHVGVNARTIRVS